MRTASKGRRYLYGWKFYVLQGGEWLLDAVEHTQAGYAAARAAYAKSGQRVRIARGRVENPVWRHLTT